MRFASFLIIAAVMLNGCSGTATDSDTTTVTEPDAAGGDATYADTSDLETVAGDEQGDIEVTLEGPSLIAPTGPSASNELSPVTIEGGLARLSSENTTIEFVGTHVGDKPDPRTGVFDQFDGQLQVDASGNLTSVSVEIATDSLQTPIEKLTNHLRSADFFDVREYPVAKFVSTRIEGQGAETKIIGNLTLLDETHEITIPANVHHGDQGLTVEGQVMLDRLQFGMDFSPDRVNKEIQLTILVGKATALPDA
jgi:polyisoprenoid-binding protein YceI